MCSKRNSNKSNRSINKQQPRNQLKTRDLFSETYQYQIWIKSDGKWKNVLFEDVTDMLGVAGDCGCNAKSCITSDVEFSIKNNNAKIYGPLMESFDSIKIKTLYQPVSLDEDDVIDEVIFNI